MKRVKLTTIAGRSSHQQPESVPHDLEYRLALLLVWSVGCGKTHAVQVWERAVNLEQSLGKLANCERT